MNAIETNELELEAGMFRLLPVTASIPKGKITAIVGPNGSGKSTLLKLVAGLQQADGGTVVINGKPAADISRSDFARTVSMLPQAREMLPELTVRELVAYGRAPHKRMFRLRLTAEDEQAIDWALKLVRIRSQEDRLVHTLSGGELQKALIAMVLTQKTDIVLLDEPTTYLDLAHQFDVMRTLAKINREYDVTVVMVLHDLQQAAAFSHHLIALKDGEVAAAGQPRDVITPRFLREVYNIEAKVNYDEVYPLIIPQPQLSEEETTMIIVTNTSKITKGDGDKLIERFNRIGKVEEMEGFLGLEVLFTQNLSDYDEVSVVTRWNSREDFQNWTRSEAFRESHAKRKTPEYIISNKITFQEVRVKRNPLAPAPLHAVEAQAQ